KLLRVKRAGRSEYVQMHLVKPLHGRPVDAGLAAANLVGEVAGPPSDDAVPADVGDGAAWMKALHDEHADGLLRYARKLTRDPRHAEDVVQETLLRAWQNREIFDDPERSVWAWLVTVVRNLIASDKRRPGSRLVDLPGGSGMPEQAHPDMA